MVRIITCRYEQIAVEAARPPVPINQTKRQIQNEIKNHGEQCAFNGSFGVLHGVEGSPHYLLSEITAQAEACKTTGARRPSWCLCW